MFGPSETERFSFRNEHAFEPPVLRPTKLGRPPQECEEDPLWKHDPWAKGNHKDRKGNGISR